MHTVVNLDDKIHIDLELGWARGETRSVLFDPIWNPSNELVPSNSVFISPLLTDSADAHKCSIMYI
jgi:hypothetical protein